MKNCRLKNLKNRKAPGTNELPTKNWHTSIPIPIYKKSMKTTEE